MTKSTGVGRGGARPGAGSGGPRPGAGRKPKPPPTIKLKPETQASAEQQINKLVSAAVTDAPTEAPAMTLVHEAYATLADVMANCPLGAPRVAAAKAIIDIARAAEARQKQAQAEATGVTGKKAAAQAVAEERMAEGSKFSAPPPPPGSFQRMQ